MGGQALEWKGGRRAGAQGSSSMEWNGGVASGGEAQAGKLGVEGNPRDGKLRGERKPEVQARSGYTIAEGSSSRECTTERAGAGRRWFVRRKACSVTRVGSCTQRAARASGGQREVASRPAPPALTHRPRNSLHTPIERRAVPASASREHQRRARSGGQQSGRRRKGVGRRVRQMPEDPPSPHALTHRLARSAADNARATHSQPAPAVTRVCVPEERVTRAGEDGQKQRCARGDQPRARAVRGSGEAEETSAEDEQTVQPRRTETRLAGRTTATGGDEQEREWRRRGAEAWDWHTHALDARASRYGRGLDGREFGGRCGLEQADTCQVSPDSQRPPRCGWTHRTTTSTLWVEGKTSTQGNGSPHRFYPYFRMNIKVRRWIG